MTTNSVDAAAQREALRRKARYGHKSYLYWTASNGEFRYALYGREAIKRAILDVGARGRFFWFDGDGNSHLAKTFSYMLHLWRCAPKQGNLAGAAE